ncbi:MAG: hypothetical protein ACRDY4_04090 [Acidimicrobiia bacterium]
MPTVVLGVAAEIPTADAPASPGAVTTDRTVTVLPSGLTLTNYQLRRAFVPGQPVRIDGTAPAGCDPVLHVDDQPAGKIDTNGAGDFSLDVDTSGLGPGQHRAEVVCSDGTILQAGFWVAAPQTSSSTLSVVLVALLVMGALGWVSVRGMVNSAFTRT